MAEPDFDDDFRCAPWTMRQGIDPIGSATRFDTLIVVELGSPWPKDVADHPLLADLEMAPGTRIQAVSPEPTGDGTVLVTRWSRPRTVDALAWSATLVGTDFRIDEPDLRAVIETLAAGSTEIDGVGDPAPDEVLVCTHGARDRCCGSSGTRLATEAAARLSGRRVRRTSHLGGHRFAPTALSLPDGRMWAYLDVDILEGILERDVPPGQAREFYRGNTALDAWAQVLEADMLDESGWGAFELEEFSTDTDVADDKRSAAVTLRYTASGATDSVSGVVEVAGTYPVIACGLPPEHATKSASIYRLR